MKILKCLVLAMVIVLFHGVSQADSCTAGPFSKILGTACTIGNTLFTFSGTNYNDFGGALNLLYFAPESSPTSSGFNISGLPSAKGDQTTYFDDYFTAVPQGGWSISSFSAKVNSISQKVDISDNSYTQLADSNYIAYDQFLNNTEKTQTGGTEPSFGVGCNPQCGYFLLLNTSEGAAGSAGFQSGDFIFNESAPVPDTSELSIVSITLLGIVGAIKKKFQTH